MTATLRTMQPEPDDKIFADPVSIEGPSGVQSVRSVRQAYDLLAGVDWPGERDERHRDASETCLKVIDGHRSIGDARDAFAAAARDAGILAAD